MVYFLNGKKRIFEYDKVQENNDGIKIRINL